MCVRFFFLFLNRSVILGDSPSINFNRWLWKHLKTSDQCRIPTELFLLALGLVSELTNIKARVCMTYISKTCDTNRPHFSLKVYAHASLLGQPKVQPCPIQLQLQQLVCNEVVPTNMEKLFFTMEKNKNKGSFRNKNCTRFKEGNNKVLKQINFILGIQSPILSTRDWLCEFYLSMHQHFRPCFLILHDKTCFLLYFIQVFNGLPFFPITCPSKLTIHFFFQGCFQSFEHL